MKDLLIHTSDKKVNVLQPHSEYNGDRPSICFSLNQFISFFGQYVYLFEKEVLERNFTIRRTSSSGVECQVGETNHFTSQRLGRFKSQDLGWEFRIYQSIDVERYCLAILTNFNHMKGVLEVKLGDRLIKEMVDFSSELK